MLSLNLLAFHLNLLIVFQHKHQYYHYLPVLGSVNEIFVHRQVLLKILIEVLYSQKLIYFVRFLLN